MVKNQLMDRKTLKLGMLLFTVNLFIAVASILVSIVFDPVKGVALGIVLVMISPLVLKKFLDKMR